MILLDDQGGGRAASSRLYEHPSFVLRADCLPEFAAACEKIESLSRGGVYWVLSLSYELGRLLNGLAPRSENNPQITEPEVAEEVEPLLVAWGFKQVRHCSSIEVEEWLELQNASSRHGLILDDSSVERFGYVRKVHAVKEKIAEGVFYQLNLTFGIQGNYFGDPLDIYTELRNQQRTRYSAAWFNILENKHLLSFSPELFLSCRSGIISARPMKGTCSISDDPETCLRSDPKNRAENIMIVDLLRNDLGRICEVGSVSATTLLSVEKVASLYQMTSEILGQIRKDVGLLDVLTASFPCGSVTGAPKRSAMEWIDRLEERSRGFYCGALGWLDPPTMRDTGDSSKDAHKFRLGDFEWSVLIRSLVLNPDSSFKMGVGAGITIDSDPEQEWKECLSKAGFLFSAPRTLGLFETIRVEQGEALRLPLHLQRLIHSCRALGISADRNALESSIKRSLGALVNAGARKANDPHRLRVSVSAMGSVNVSLHPLGPNPNAEIFWADDLLGDGLGVTQKQNPTLRHKVDHRPAYDQAWQRAESLGGFDAIFTNQDGEVTEGGRSNIFIKKDGVWLTPPLSSGLLPGIMRAELLASKDWNARESVIYPADVESAQQIVVCNSLRGAMKVNIKGKP